MNLPLFISRRLNLKAEGNRRRSPGISVAVAGVAVAIVVLMLTLAVVTGFKDAIRQKVTGFDSQITLTPVAGESGGYRAFAPDSALVSVIKAVAGGNVEISTGNALTGLLKTDDDFAGLSFVSMSDGGSPEKFIAGSITDGLMPDFTDEENRNTIVISRQTADRMLLGVGDRPFLHFVSGDGGVRTRRVTVGGIYDTGFAERDKLVAFVSPGFLENVCGIDSGYVGRIELNGLDYNTLVVRRSELQQALNTAYYLGEIGEMFNAADVIHTGAVYFNWLALLDTNVAVLIILMTVIAAFTLVSSLFILILERVKLIGILKSLGATDSQVRRIFIYMAMKIAIAGMLIGNVAGLAVIAIQRIYHVIPLDPEAYYLSYVPVELTLAEFIWLNAGALAVAWAVLVLPTVIISRISPASTMRYE